MSLKPAAAQLSFVNGLRATDADGMIIHGLVKGEPTFSVRGHAYFEQARLSTSTVISEPIYSSALGERFIVMAHPLRTADGIFQGVVYAVLAAHHFQSLFNSMAVGKDGEISLRSPSTNLVAHSSAADAITTVFRDLSEQLPANFQYANGHDLDHGWFVARSGSDGVERMIAYRKVPGRDFVVLAGVGLAGYFAHWSAEMHRQWLLTGAILLMVVGGFIYVAGQHRLQVAAGARAARTAREQELVLNNDLVGMVRVEGRNILWANRAIHRILGYDDGSVVGVSMRMLYPDEATFQHVGVLGYEALRRDGRFHTQVKMRTKSGKDIWIDLSATALTETEFLWMIVDIHDLKQSEERAQHQALHDGLTGLANRHLFEELLRQSASQAKRENQTLALCYLDLDGFKPINDTYGHHAGDLVLRTVGERLQRELRDNDSVARLGGDEFAWFLTGEIHEAEAQAVVQRCVDAISEPIQLESGVTVRMGASVGMASSAMHGYLTPKLLTAADEAMYRVKRDRKTH